MRRWLSASVLAALACTANAEPRELTLDIQGMTCATCPLTVRIALKKLPGVTEAKVDFATHSARVGYDDAKVQPDAIAKAATDAGFPSRVRKP